jgi:hypothetical protein
LSAVASAFAAAELISRGTFMWSSRDSGPGEPAKVRHFTAFDKRGESWAVWTSASAKDAADDLVPDQALFK